MHLLGHDQLSVWGRKRVYMCMCLFFHLWSVASHCSCMAVFLYILKHVSLVRKHFYSMSLPVYMNMTCKQICRINMHLTFPLLVFLNDCFETMTCHHETLHVHYLTTTLKPRHLVCPLFSTQNSSVWTFWDCGTWLHDIVRGSPGSCKVGGGASVSEAVCS